MIYSDKTKQEIRGYLKDYLIRKGINPENNFTCLNPEHEDRHPSMSYHDETKRCHCFSCGANYDIFDLIGMDYQLQTFSEKAAKACELYGITPETSGDSYRTEKAPAQPKEKTDYSEMIRTAAVNLDNSPAADYLAKRGISTGTAARFALGYDPAFTASNGETWEALVIPTGDMIHSLKARNLDPDAKNRYEVRGSGALFNARAISESDKPVFITEGEIDALSIIEAGGEAAALGSVNYISKLTDYLKTSKPKKYIIPALDQDKAGQDAETKLCEELKRYNIPFFRLPGIYGKTKDANEALQKDPEGFRHRIQTAEDEVQRRIRAEYNAECNVSVKLSGFLQEVAESAYNRPISTGFRNLDKIMDGGLYKGLYIIGAISSLGKTTFCLQIADQIAEAGNDVLIFSLEMSAYELIGKSLSRNTVQIAMQETSGRRDYAKTYRGITDGSRYAGYSDKDKARINQAMKKYRGYSDHVFVYEGIGKISVEDIREAVRRHKEITGNYPVVIIDYLQILKPADPHMTDKQATDSNITALKQLARELPVISISSMNRESYKAGGKNNGRVSITDLKESGGIDYGADIIIGLQFLSAGDYETDANGRKKNTYDERSAKKEDPRKIVAVILKNRNGAVYGEANFNYIPQFNCFLEV